MHAETLGGVELTQKLRRGYTKPGRVPNIECNRYNLGHQCCYTSHLTCGKKPCVGYYETKNARFRTE